MGSLAREFMRILENVLDEGPRELIVDLAQVDMMNSKALSALLRAQGEMEERRGHFTIVNLQPSVREMLDATETRELLEIRS